MLSADAGAVCTYSHRAADLQDVPGASVVVIRGRSPVVPGCLVDHSNRLSGRGQLQGVLRERPGRSPAPALLQLLAERAVFHPER